MTPITFNHDEELVLRLRGSLRQAHSTADLRAIWRELDATREALRNLVELIDEADGNRDGELLGSLADARCPECTSGTTPYKDMPRPCAYHAARAAVVVVQ